MPTGKLFGMGNPLLDISSEVDQAFLDKYELKAGNAILAEEKHMPLYAELSKRPDVVYIPGGATLNAIRVANWVAQGSNGWATYTGSISEDEYGKILKEKAEQEGLHMPMYITKEAGTGTCGVCVVGGERSLVANLAAASKFDQSHMENPAVVKAVEEAAVYYIAGFFLTTCPPAALKVAEHSLSKEKHFCMNLSADFIINFFTEHLDNMMPYIDVLFGNETEAKALSAKKGWGTEKVEEIAVHAQKLEKKGRKRIVVFTQGADATVVADESGVKTFPVTPVEKVVDTNGAGDAFVGGFLANFCNGKDIATCVNAGHAAARCIIQVSGCQFSGKPPQ